MPIQGRKQAIISSLGEGGIKFWNLEFDPFSELPLYFDNYSDYNFLVKNSNINLMSNICAQLNVDSVSKILLILGERGSGKTSALRYLNSLLEEKMEEKKDISIYCNVYALEDKGYHQIRNSLHRAIFNSLMEKSAKLGMDIDIQSYEKIASYDDLFTIDREIRRMLAWISHYHDRIFFFIDNLDKSEPKRYKEYEAYFRKNQGFYEEITKRTTFLLIAMQSSIGTFLKSSHETEYLGRKTFRMERWNSDELDQLISKRLQYAYSGHDFHLTNFFEPGALNIVYEKSKYLPRPVINSCRNLLERAYQMSRQEMHEIPCKPIRKIFLKMHKDCIGDYSKKEYIDFAIIDRVVSERYQKASKLIENCFRKNEAMIDDLIEAIFAIRKKGSFDNRIIIHILEKMGIIEQLVRKKRKYYQICPRIESLIGYLMDVMGNDEDSVKYYLSILGFV